MPRHRFASAVLVVLSVLASMQLSGCTAIGYGIGALVDRSDGRRMADPIVRVPTGTRVTIRLRDGRQLRGRFLGRRDASGATPSPAAAGGSGASAGSPPAVILLGTNQGTQQVPIEEVDRVSAQVTRGKLTGAIAGAALDALLLYAIIHHDPYD